MTSESTPLRQTVRELREIHAALWPNRDDPQILSELTVVQQQLNQSHETTPQAPLRSPSPSLRDPHRSTNFPLPAFNARGDLR
jgi:hypothetical protein